MEPSCPAFSFFLLRRRDLTPALAEPEHRLPVRVLAPAFQNNLIAILEIPRLVGTPRRSLRHNRRLRHLNLVQTPQLGLLAPLIPPRPRDRPRADEIPRLHAAAAARVVRELLVRRPVHVLQVAGAERVLLAVADERDFQFHVQGAVAGGFPRQVREGLGVLRGVRGAGEGLEGFQRHDPVADAGAEAFGVERSLYRRRKTHQLSARIL